jgi:hypothetical protein
VQLLHVATLAAAGVIVGVVSPIACLLPSQRVTRISQVEAPHRIVVNRFDPPMWTQLARRQEEEAASRRETEQKKLLEEVEASAARGRSVARQP